MEQLNEKKSSRRIVAMLLDEIKSLEENILETPSLIMSEYISTAHKENKE